jgi:alcohol dehydrogenase class IV
MSTHHWLAQQRVHQGAPVADSLPGELAGADRVVLATTRSLAGGRIASVVRAAIGPRLVGTHDAMRAHSPIEDVGALARMLRDTGAELVVTLGGGSVIDGAKVACFAAWRGIGDAAALLAALPRSGTPSAWDGPAPSPRIVAVPTTLSAAEFAAHAGVTDLAAGRKHRAVHPFLVPKAVVLDPVATLETPAELLLSSGIRAVDHAAERWCSAAPAAFSDAVSLQALSMLAEALPAIRRDPEDLAARAAAQQAAWLSIMGGWAGVPVGASHGIGYILGAARGVPHGITSCVSLPAVMRWNAPVNGARQAEVARVFGGAEAHAALRGFIAGLGLPVRLRDVGIAESEIPALAARYDGSAPIATNPRPVEGPAALEEILRLAA